MSLDLLFADTTDNFYHFTRFKAGDEKALDYFYTHAYQPLVKYGMRIMDDEFSVSTIVHEAILKTWDFREHMETMFHIYCFARLNVKWGCISWYHKPENRIYRQTYMDEFIESRPEPKFFDDDEATAREHRIDEENLKRIYEVLPYLPARRKTMLMLYFKYGLGYNEIAHRFATSNKKISTEVQKGLEFLKDAICKIKGVDPKRGILDIDRQHLKKILTEEQLMIYQMKIVSKYSIEDISIRLGLSPGKILDEYMEARKIVKTAKANSYACKTADPHTESTVVC